MLPKEIVIFCFMNRRGFQNHANRYLRMLERVSNEHPIDLTLENDEKHKWKPVMIRDNDRYFIVKFNYSTLEIKQAFKTLPQGAKKYKYFTHGLEMFMIGEAGK